jgi:hypothetical protein
LAVEFFPTQPIVQMERAFRQKFDALRHGKILKWDAVLKRGDKPHVHVTSRFV